MQCTQEVHDPWDGHVGCSLVGLGRGDAASKVWTLQSFDDFDVGL